MGREKLTIKEVIYKSKLIHNHINYDYSLLVYGGSNKKITIICPIKNHGIFKLFPFDHFNGKGCPKCSQIKKIEEFNKKANLLHNNKYYYSLDDYIDSQTKIKIICPEHGEFKQRVADHLMGRGCLKCGKISCGNKQRKINSQFILESSSIHNNKFDYSKFLYLNANSKGVIICPIHGEFKQTPHSHLYGQGCPKCKNLIEGFLKENNIEFISQHRFSECRDKLPLPFDFYLPDYNVCIEYDGRQHFISYDRWGGEKQLLDTKNKDKIKNKYCEEYNIKLTRISYKDNIRLELSKLLTNIVIK